MEVFMSSIMCVIFFTCFFLISNQLDAQLTKLWQTSYDGTSATRDVLTCSAVDQEGNLYAAGFSGHTSDLDYVVSKYSPEGQLLWSAKQDGPKHIFDLINAICLDKNANVYVTGVSNYSLEGGDIMTVKYNSDGIQQWVRIFDGEVSGTDEAFDISVDNSGDVLLCGRTKTINSTRASVLKYNADGDLVWLRTFSAPSQLYSWAYKLQVDTANNVYTVGTYTDSSGQEHGILLKYDSEGNSVWSNIVGDEFFVEMYELGLTNDGIVVGGHISGVNHYEIILAKYSLDGDSLWAERYRYDVINRADLRDLTVDKFGNTYMTGSAHTGSDDIDRLFIVAYDPNGIKKWENAYTSPRNGNESANSVVSDSIGNVYIAGYATSLSDGWDMIVVKFDFLGNQEWFKRYNGSKDGPDLANSVTVSSNGIVYLCGTSNELIGGENFINIAYDKEGNELWKTSYNSTTSSKDILSGMTIDDSGNVIMTGASSTGIDENDTDFLTVKYSPNGNVLWSKIFKGDTSFFSKDAPQDIINDKDGNIYITGMSGHSSQGKVFITTLKYSPDGDLLWARNFESPSDKPWNNSGHYLTVDDSGNVYVGGNANWYSDQTDYTIIKYNKYGNQMWVSTYSGIQRQNAITGLVLDDSGNVYATGLSQGDDYFYDFATVKFNNVDGSTVWSARYNGLGNINHIPYSISIDESGNVYVTGTYGITIKYNRNGEIEWIKNKPTDDAIGGKSIIDKSGNLVVAYYNLSGLHLLKFNKAGLLIGESISANPPKIGRIINLETDNNNNVYVLGYSYASGFNQLLLTKYSSTGHLVWVISDTSNSFARFGLDKNYNIILSKNTYNRLSEHDYWLAKYSQQVTEVEEIVDMPDFIKLYQSYPNPFNPTTTIEYDLSVATFVTLKIFNTLGQEVTTLVNEMQSPGYKSIKWNASNLPSGIYFYRLTAGKFTDVRKLNLIR